MQERPLFLITNDDGIKAPGIIVLKETMKQFGDVVTIAPDDNRSGFSHSITLTRPLKLIKIADNEYSLDGSPVDCVLFGLRSILKRLPDFIVSGINRGPNLGDDTLYSGTVGAAISGVLHGIPGMAVSLAGFDKPFHYDSAGEVVARLFASPLLKQAAVMGALNVNVPNAPIDQIKGVKVAGLGRRHYDQGFEADSVEKDSFWYGEARPGHDGVGGTDSVEVENDFATITVLKPSYFDAENNQRLKDLWPKNLLSFGKEK